MHVLRASCQAAKYKHKHMVNQPCKRDERSQEKEWKKNNKRAGQTNEINVLFLEIINQNVSVFCPKRISKDGRQIILIFMNRERLTNVT